MAVRRFVYMEGCYQSRARSKPNPCPRLTLNPALFPGLSEENLSSRIDRLNSTVQQVLSTALQQSSTPCVTSPVSYREETSDTETLLNRAQMQLEDVFGSEMRKECLMWESEEEIDIAGGVSARQERVPSSPASSPPKVIRLGGVEHVEDQTKEVPIPWHCSQRDLLEVYLSLQTLLSQTSPCVPTLLRIGPIQLSLWLRPTPPNTPHFPSKPLLAHLLTSSIFSPAQPTLLTASQAYLHQLENELLGQESMQKVQLNCPHNEGNKEQWAFETELFRIYPRQPSDLEAGIKARVTTVERDLSLTQAVAKWQMRDLQRAIKDLKECREEYVRRMGDREEIARELGNMRKEREKERGDIENMRTKMRLVEGKAAQVSEALQAFLRQPSLPPSLCTENSTALDPQIQALESQLTRCSTREAQHLNIKLSLLRNKQVKLRSESVLLGCQMKAQRLLQRAMTVDYGDRGKEGEWSAMSACTSPNKRSFHRPSSSFSLLNVSIAPSELCPSSPPSVSLLSSLSTRIHELETALTVSSRKAQDLVEVEIQVKAEQKRLKAYNDRLLKRETQLRDREMALLGAEKEEMREKYVEIVRGFYKRERKASEDFMKVKIGEEELAHERLVEERKDLSKLLTAIEERVAASGKVQTALLSLYAELQGLSLS